MSSLHSNVRFVGSTRFYQVLTFVLGVALVVSAFFVCFPTFQPSVAGEFYDLGVSISPEGSVKLGVGVSQNFSATVTGGQYPYTFTWTSQVHYQNGTVGEILLLKEDVVTQWWIDKYFDPNQKPVSSWCFNGFPFAMEDYFVVMVNVVDGLGGSQGVMTYVFDPYTSPTQYLNGANSATYSYKIETDGLGWYRAINGSDGSIIDAWTSTNAGTTINSALLLGNTFVADGYYAITTEQIMISSNREFSGSENAVIDGSSYDATGDPVNALVINENWVNTTPVTYDENITINGFSFVGSGGDGTNPTFAICFGGLKNGLVKNSVMYDIPKQGFATIESENIRCSGLRIIDAGQDAINYYTVNGGSIENCFIQTKDQLAADNNGIEVEADSKNIVVAKNIVKMDTGTLELPGIMIGGSDGGASFISVIDNILIDVSSGPGGAASHIQVRSASSNILIKNNLCTNEGGSRTGVRVQEASHDILIIDNVFNETKVGVYTLAGTYQITVRGNTVAYSQYSGVSIESTNTEVISNKIFDSSRSAANQVGILLDGTSENPVRNVTIKNNQIFDDTGTQTQKIAIWEFDNSDYNVIENNYIWGNQYSIVFSSTNGQHNIVRNNVGYNPVGFKNSIIDSTGGTLLVDSGTNSTWVSNTVYTNYQSPKTLYVSGGTVTAIAINGQNTGLTSGTFVLQPKDTFKMTFSSAPLVNAYVG